MLFSLSQEPNAAPAKPSSPPEGGGAAKAGTRARRLSYVTNDVSTSCPVTLPLDCNFNLSFVSIAECAERRNIA